MLFALGLSMASYFGLAVECKNYTYQLATANLYFYFFNQLLALGFIFYGLFLIKKRGSRLPIQYPEAKRGHHAE